MTALLWLAAAAAPGCPAALAGAARDVSPQDLAAAAPAAVARLADEGAGPAHALSAEADALAEAVAAGPPAAAEAAERFRARLARHCALAAERPGKALAFRDRLALERILARPEFGRARADADGTGRWLAELWRRLLDLLGTEEAGRYAAGGRTGFFAAVALSLAATLAWALRRRRGRPGPAPGRLPVAVPPADGSQVLARTALQRGLWLEALRQAFLGLLAALERAGRIPRGRTLTNRELAAHLGASRAPGSPLAPNAAPDGIADAFADLASRFDRAVYGGAPVAGEEAAAFLERARQLAGRAEGGA